MTHAEYDRIEAYMLEKMRDAAHDCRHIYRVLNLALRVAEGEDCDKDVLMAACLLHDVGREAQFRDKSVNHARAGAEMAYDFLRSIDWEERRASHVRDCVRTHRFRGDDPPVTFEAKALYDADKLDVVGAMGIARTLLYAGANNCPLYTLDELADETDRKTDSFLREYRKKLSTLYGRFLTPAGARMAQPRREAAEAFYEALLREAREAEKP